jgi:hypothetical protein
MSIVCRTVTRRYVEVGNDQVVALDIVYRQSILPCFYDLNGMASRDKHLLKRGSHVVVVVNYQDLSLHKAQRRRY